MTTDLQWRRVAFEWHLYLGRRRVGRVIPDAVHKGMWRSVMPDDSLSDMANLSWAKSAVLASERGTSTTKRATAARLLRKTRQFFSRFARTCDFQDRPLPYQPPLTVICLAELPPREAPFGGLSGGKRTFTNYGRERS